MRTPQPAPGATPTPSPASVRPTRNPRPDRWGSLPLAIASATSALLLAFITAVVVAGGTVATGLDVWVLDVTAAWTDDQPWAVDVAETVGAFTDVVPSTALGVLVTIALLLARQWRLAAYLATSGLLGVVVVEVLKRSVGRQRPAGAEEFISASGMDRSFPSGHAAVGVYVYVAIGVLLLLVGLARGSAALRAVGWVVAVLGVSLGLSRIVLGVHEATDVLAGWALGSAVLLAVTAALRPDDVLLAVVPRAGGSASRVARASR